MSIAMNMDVLQNLVPFVQFKYVKNSYGGMLLLVKLQALSLKVTLFNGWFSRFLNCTNGTKLRDASIKLVKI